MTATAPAGAPSQSAAAEASAPLTAERAVPLRRLFRLPAASRRHLPGHGIVVEGDADPRGRGQQPDPLRPVVEAHGIGRQAGEDRRQVGDPATPTVSKGWLDDPAARRGGADGRGGRTRSRPRGSRRAPRPTAGAPARARHRPGPPRTAPCLRWRSAPVHAMPTPSAPPPEPAVPSADGATAGDPVLLRRARIAHLVELGNRIGYGLFAVAVVAFVVGAAAGFSTPTPSWWSAPSRWARSCSLRRSSSATASRPPSGRTAQRAAGPPTPRRAIAAPAASAACSAASVVPATPGRRRHGSGTVGDLHIGAAPSYPAVTDGRPTSRPSPPTAVARRGARRVRRGGLPRRLDGLGGRGLPA